MRDEERNSMELSENNAVLHLSLGNTKLVKILKISDRSFIDDSLFAFYLSRGQCRFQFLHGQALRA